MNLITNQTFDEERALYALQNTEVTNCTFAGPADGESAFKESSNISVDSCTFNLRYPFWHTSNADIKNITMSETCRAALWYDNNIKISHATLGGIKALRECHNVTLKNCNITSAEFGWLCSNLNISECELTSEYPFFMSHDLVLDKFTMKAKYSFQYVNNMTITNSYLDTKDAFWHSNNVTVIDSVVKGEYLAWYSKNLHLIRCKIIGTQPLCYAEGLILEDCETIDCDLAFEYSDVNATIKGSILSVKNPKSGRIKADSYGEIILDENRCKDTVCEIL